MTLRPVIGLEDVFGERAMQFRKIQARLLDIYREAGFEEVIPPLLERPESLNSGAGRFLNDQTLVFNDTADAGLLAIRPDITPQIARIAATRMQHEAVLKLCYSGEVVLSRPDIRSGSRQQWQTGVELMGVAGCEADVEVMHLAAMSLHAAGFHDPVLQVGHFGLLKALVTDSKAPVDIWAEILLRRSPDDMQKQLTEEKLPEDRGKALLDMAAGLADRAWLEKMSGSLGETFSDAASEVMQLVDTVSMRLRGEVRVHLDAAVMPRFLYHNGLIFAGFAAGAAQALLYGGRYDDMMRQHGRDMPATGFSCDLWSWLDAGMAGRR